MERVYWRFTAGARRGLSDPVGKDYGKGGPSGLGCGLPKMLIKPWGSGIGSTSFRGRDERER